MARIALVGAFDTKSEPLLRLVDELRSLNERPITIDTSVFPIGVTCDYPAAEVAARVGESLGALAEQGRARAVSAMAEGACRIIAELCDRGDIGALVCTGGSNAATVFGKVAAVVPVGIPKILMATVIAGEMVAPLVNASDVTLLYPIVDIEGQNFVLDKMIKRLALVAAGVSQSAFSLQSLDPGRSVALTMFGVTTACVSRCRALLVSEGLECLVFHANGAGGHSVEQFVREGRVSSVIDLTTTELADELFGGVLSAGPERLRTAAMMGVPQVLAPGALDMINFGPASTVPKQFRSRSIVQHNAMATLVRTSPEENYNMGAEIGRRLAGATAPTILLVPLRGFSALDKPGGPFFDPDAVRAFFDGAKSTAEKSLEIRTLDLHINDPDFAAALVKASLAGRASAKKPSNQK